MSLAKGSPNESVEQGTPRSGVAKDHAAGTMMKIYRNIPTSNLAFILALAAPVFAFSILVALPVQLVEALDGNLYAIRFNNEDVPAAIKRYNGTTELSSTPLLLQEVADWDLFMN